MTDAEQEQPKRDAGVGRGAVAIAAAKIWFVLAGFIVQFALPRALGSAAEYGLYSLSLSLVSVLNNLMIAATVQTVSKLVSEDERSAEPTLRQALRLQVGVGATLAAALALAAGPIARGAGDPALAKPLAMASVILFAYAVYATLVGMMNGQQRFVTQARFDAAFTAMRSLGLLAGAVAFGAFGAIAGFSAAAITIATAALVVVGVGRPGEGAPLRRIVAVMAPTWLFQGTLNALLQLDSWVLKLTLAARGADAGLAATAAAEAANVACGFYKGAQNFAFAPYQLVLTAALIVFPMVSKATSSGDVEAAGRAIRGAARFSFLASLAMAAPIAGAARGVLDLPYSEDYLIAADALSVLSFGIVAFTMLAVAATVLAGSGKPVHGAAIAGLGLVLMLVLDVLFLRAADGTHDTLVALALGTSVAMALAAAVATVRVVAQFGTFLPGSTALRGVVAGAAGFFVSRTIVGTSALSTLLATATGFVVVVGVLVLSGELSDAIAAVRTRLEARRAKKGS